MLGIIFLLISLPCLCSRMLRGLPMVQGGHLEALLAGLGVAPPQQPPESLVVGGVQASSGLPNKLAPHVSVALVDKNRIAPSLSRLYTSKVSYPLTMLSHSAQDSCLKAHYFAPVLRSWPRHKTFSYALYSCLLLKPTSTHHANCPISSACRLTRASILLSHIEGVSTSL